MIHGTGVDLIEIDRIRNSLDKYLEKFEERVFTKAEIDYCRSKADPPKHFAGRFAAKEAILKSIGTGMADGIAWKDLEIVTRDSGQPELKVSGKAKALCDSKKIKTIHVSISHEKGYAIAQAIAETA